MCRNYTLRNACLSILSWNTRNQIPNGGDEGQQSFILNQREYVLNAKRGSSSITVQELNATRTSLDHRLRDPKSEWVVWSGCIRRTQNFFEHTAWVNWQWHILSIIWKWQSTIPEEINIFKESFPEKASSLKLRKQEFMIITEPFVVKQMKKIWRLSDTEEKSTEQTDSSIRNLEDREDHLAKSCIPLRSQAMLWENLHLPFVQSIYKNMCSVFPICILKKRP